MRIPKGLLIAMLFVASALSAQDTSPTVMLQAPPPSAPAPDVPSHTPNGAVRISGGVMALLLVSRVEPVYPPDTDAQGSVVLHALIGPDGFVTKLTALSGVPALRSAALDAVRQWRYQPYLLNGKPVTVDTTIVVNFRR